MLVLTYIAYSAVNIIIKEADDMDSVRKMGDLDRRLSDSDRGVMKDALGKALREFKDKNLGLFNIFVNQLNEELQSNHDELIYDFVEDEKTEDLQYIMRDIIINKITPGMVVLGISRSDSMER